MSSEKSPAEKMSFKSGWSIRTHNAPTEYETMMGLPTGAHVDNKTAHPDALQLFVENLDVLDAQFDDVVDAAPAGIPVWVTFPKPAKNDKNPSINRELVMRAVAQHGWKAVTGISISDDWSTCRVKPQD